MVSKIFFTSPILSFVPKLFVIWMTFVKVCKLRKGINNISRTFIEVCYVRRIVVIFASL